MSNTTHLTVEVDTSVADRTDRILSENLPFSQQSKREFHVWIGDPKHVNRFRKSQQQQQEIEQYLLNPDMPASTPEQSQIKYWAPKLYTMHQGSLYKLSPGNDQASELYVVP